jgi:hypothetical protein
MLLCTPIQPASPRMLFAYAPASAHDHHAMVTA